MSEIKIWICNDCGAELLDPYCLDCKSENSEEKENYGDER